MASGWVVRSCFCRNSHHLFPVGVNFLSWLRMLFDLIFHEALFCPPELVSCLLCRHGELRGAYEPDGDGACGGFDPKV